IAGPAQPSRSLDSGTKANHLPPLGKARDQLRLDTPGWLRVGIVFDLIPERLAILIRNDDIVAHPNLSLIEQNGARGDEPFAVAGEDGRAGLLQGQLGIRCERGAGCEAQEVERIWHDCGFIEVINAPYEPPFPIPPDAEIFCMRIADGAHLRCLCHLRTPIEDFSSPAVVGGAQEHKSVLAHLLMLTFQVMLENIALCSEPPFVGLSVSLQGHCHCPSLCVPETQTRT